MPRCRCDECDSCNSIYFFFYILSMSSLSLIRRWCLPVSARGYATRRPEKPPSKLKDPLDAPNAVHYKISPNLTFVHRPPPTAPSPYSLTTAPVSPLLQPVSGTPSSEASLPPRLQKPTPAPEHQLTPEQIEEVRRLRNEDPVTWTRQKLAKKFGCKACYISMIAPLDKQTHRALLAERDAGHEQNRSRWGENKATARAIRRKRRSLW